MTTMTTRVTSRFPRNRNTFGWWTVSCRRTRARPGPRWVCARCSTRITTTRAGRTRTASCGTTGTSRTSTRCFARRRRITSPERDSRRSRAATRGLPRDELGCAGVTPVWLSCYVEGMRQELHADVPHGPWAFVLSLTRWDERTWTGGETLILKPSTLDYWSSFDADATVERESLVELVQPRFNRLTVFDPRLPHGVPVVEGVRDPSQGRLSCCTAGSTSRSRASRRARRPQLQTKYASDDAPRRARRRRSGITTTRDVQKKTRAYAELSEDRPNEDEALDFRYYANTGDAASEARTFEVLGEDVLPDLYATLATLPVRARHGRAGGDARGGRRVFETEDRGRACSRARRGERREFSASETRDAIMLEIAAALLSHEGWAAKRREEPVGRARGPPENPPENRLRTD